MTSPEHLQYVREEYVRLLRRRAHAQQIEERIEGLLSRANAKREGAEQQDKWSQVIDRLDFALDEVKGRLFVYEQAMKRQEKRAQKTGLELPSLPADAAPDNSGEWNVETMMEASVADAARLLDGLEEDTDGSCPAGPVQSSDAAHAAGRGRRLFEKRPPTTTVAERRQRKKLRGAMDKVIVQDFDALMVGEVELLLSALTSAESLGDSDTSRERLRGMLSGFIADLQTRCSCWQRAMRGHVSI